MEAQVTAIGGPLEGARFALAGELTIGRDKGNAVAIDDRALSRRHCVIRTADDGFQIEDLGSSNGTYVNGLPISTRPLREGDRITAGQSLFLFSRGQNTPSSPPLEMCATSINAASTVMLRAEDAYHLRTAKLPQDERSVKNLEIVLRIATSLSSIRGLQSLQRQLLELILEAIPAERGAILQTGTGPGEFASVYNLDPTAPSRPMQVSSTVVDRVLREGIALLSNDVGLDSGISLTESIVQAQVRSLLAVPLIAFDQTLGVLYLDSRKPGVKFDEDHLQLLTGIAVMSAGPLENALYVESLQSENHRLKAQADVEYDMVGSSSRMRHVFEFVRKVATSGSTVLIRGESGTGKELVARAVHRNSGRSAKPFMALNCAALSEALLESELFGHEKGAFTGAVVQKKGKLEEASGGSVFLDELGELAPSLQAKLLRVIQEREFERVGGTRPIKADIRLIAATNRDLEEAVKNGTFRRDLYYRLNVVSVVLPPLRERREDIVPLANHLIRKHARNACRRVIGISEEARSYLLNYDWPGNVRELENAMERAVVLGSTEQILPEDLPECVLETEVPELSAAGGFHDLVREAKKQIILRAIETANGNYTDAAKRLQLHASNLHRLIRTLNLREDLRK